MNYEMRKKMAVIGMVISGVSLAAIILAIKISTVDGSEYLFLGGIITGIISYFLVGSGGYILGIIGKAFMCGIPFFLYGGIIVSFMFAGFAGAAALFLPVLFNSIYFLKVYR